MPRSYQAYPQNAVVTHSPANAGTGSGSPNSALNQAQSTFQTPSLLDICTGVTNGTQNPFMSGLNDMGDGGNTSGIPGQTGNMLSGLQQFADSLCSFGTGGIGFSSSEVLKAARQIRTQGGNVKETVAALRQLRATVGTGTTPQSVIAGVSQVNDAANNSPMASGILGMGQADGSSGNIAVDGINGVQSFSNAIFSILQLCGCQPQADMLIRGGPLQAGDTFNPYAPANITPDIIISTVQAISDAVAANPIAANIIAQGLPGSGGNIGVAAVNGGAATATAFQNDVSAASTLGQENAQAISYQAINNSNYHAVDRTLNAVFNISSLTGSSPDTVVMTQDASEIGFITIPTSTIKTFGVFIGYKTGTLTSVYVNVYSVNTATQTLTLVSTSVNQASSLTGSLQWIYAQLQTDIPVVQGQYYAVELAVEGPGSLTIIGMPNHWLIANPSSGVYPAKLAAMRSTNVFDSSVAFAGTGSVTSGSYTHVIGALATAFYLVVNAVPGGGSPTATCGGTAMTLKTTFSYTGGKLYVWQLFSPPTGSQTIAFTGLTSSLVSAASVAFNGVSASGTPVTASGSGTALSQSATGTSGGLLFQAFGYSAGTGTITGYNQTLAASEAGSSGNDDPLAVGYAVATGSSQTFTATGSVSDPWGAVAIPLTATIPTVTAPSTLVAPAYSPNVPWLALSSVIPAPQTLTPGTGTLTLTPGSPEVTYPGSPKLFMRVDITSATSHTLSNAYNLVKYTGSADASWTLPSIAASNGLVLFLYNRGTATVTVTCGGADHFLRPTGATTLTLLRNSSVTLTNDGTYWLAI